MRLSSFDRQYRIWISCHNWRDYLLERLFLLPQWWGCVNVHVMNGQKDVDTAKVSESPSRDELRLRIMRLLERHPEMSQRDIARELGVSLGGVNYALKALIERGCIKAGNFGRSENKAAYLYLLTPEGVAQKSALAAIFLSRKLEAYEALKQEIKSLEQEVRLGRRAES